MPGWFWVAAIVLALVILYILIRRKPKPLVPESLFGVSFGPQGIQVTDPSGAKRSAAWERLTRVTIRTTDAGPFNPDVFWCFYESAEEPAAIFPGGAKGDPELLKELQSRLPGFDNDRVIEAMGSTSNATFVVWTRRDDQ